MSFFLREAQFSQPDPDGVMADLKDDGEFLERGIGMLFNVRLKFLGIERAPLAPAGFRGERPGLGGGEVAIDRAPGQLEAAGRLDLGAARLKKLHHPFPQIQRISFHAQSLPSYVPMSMLIAIVLVVSSALILFTTKRKA